MLHKKGQTQVIVSTGIVSLRNYHILKKIIFSQPRFKLKKKTLDLVFCISFMNAR